MSVVKKQARVPYSCEQMFDLVNDVVRYPEFISWCHHAEVLSPDDNPVLATLGFSMGLINKDFTTRNLLESPHRIEMVLERGPFRDLRGVWTFDDVDGGCLVALDLTFAWTNVILEQTMGVVFYQAANSLVDQFVSRAHGVYRDES